MKVVNVGSLNLDRTYRLRDFVRPEETVRALSFEQHCGGKGLNQSIALARAGAEAWHVGLIGPEGSALAEALAEAGVTTTFVDTAEVATGHAVIQVTERGQNNIIVYGGANEAIEADRVREALASCSEGDYVLVQNETSVTGLAITEAKDRGLTIVLNPSPLDERIASLRLDLVDIFMVNRLEAVALANMSASDGAPALAEDAPLEAVTGALSRAFPTATFVLTLGEHGSMLFDATGVIARCPAFKVDAVDTTGAGDTFCGYFLAERILGASGDEALRWSSAASAIAVSRAGAAPSIPTRTEVEAFLEQHAEEETR